MAFDTLAMLLLGELKGHRPCSLVWFFKQFSSDNMGWHMLLRSCQRPVEVRRTLPIGKSQLPSTPAST